MPLGTLSQLNRGTPNPDPSSPLDEASRTKTERQRGLWNFLTWSFVLANFLTASEVMGGSAHAGAMTADPEHGSHSSDDGAQTLQSTSSPIHGASLEGSSAATQFSGAEVRLATNLISPVEPSSNATAFSPYAEGTNSHAGPVASGGAATSAGNTVDMEHHGVTGSDLSSITDPLHGSAPPLAHDVDTLIHTVGDVAGDIAHAAGEIVTTLGNTLETTIGAVDHAVSTIVSDAGEITSFAAHTVLNEIGLSSPGSLTFAADTTDHLIGDSSAPMGGYSQYNISVQDAGAPDTPTMPTDVGGISTIISTALGFGQHTEASHSNSLDHSEGQQSHNSLPDDLTSNVHHALFG